MSHVLIGFHGFIALGNGEVTVSDSSDPYFIFSKNINIAGMVYRSACAAINSTKVGYATVGEAPNRQFVVEYTDMQIGVNGWEGYAARDTVCLQIRLHETSGKVEIITKGFEPSAAVAADLNWNDMFKIGICGINKDMTCKASSFTDDSFADNDELRSAGEPKAILPTGRHMLSFHQKTVKSPPHHPQRYS